MTLHHLTNDGYIRVVALNKYAIAHTTIPAEAIKIASAHITAITGHPADKHASMIIYSAISQAFCGLRSLTPQSGSITPFAVRLRGGCDVGDAVFRSMCSYPCSTASCTVSIAVM